MSAASDHHEPFLAAIRANPADDLPRLVYADWLDEREETDLAEFIRVQCRLVNPPWNSKDMIREGQLWKLLRERFRSSVGEKWTVHSSQVRPCAEEDTLPSAIISRGFVHTVRCRIIDWIGSKCDGPLCVDGFVIAQGRQCFNCAGAGRILGFGSQVVASHPVERVVVTDLSPIDVGSTPFAFRNNLVAAWHLRGESRHAGRSHLLPEFIFNRLTGGQCPDPYTARYYASTDEAIADFDAISSPALIAWAKQQLIPA